MTEKINLGKYTIAEKWEDVTLKQWENYMRRVADDEENKIDLVSALEVFSDIPREVINQLPSELFERILSKMSFLRDDVSKIVPDNKVEIDGEIYTINTMEKLKVKEYLDTTTILENDKYNYSALFGVLCRKEGEVYDEEFAADKLGERIEMFQNMPALEGLKLVAFFLTSYEILKTHSVNSLMVKGIKEDVTKLVKNIENSQHLGVFTTVLHPQRTIRLRKLKKSLQAIS